MKKRKIGWQYLGGSSSVEEDLLDIGIDDDDEYDDSNQGHGPMDFGMDDMMSAIDFTPMGVYHKDDIMNVHNHFDFWICHTNFKLTATDISKLMEVDGVEVINPYWTPYRIVIAPGKMFSFMEVRLGIEEVLCADEAFQFLNEYLEDEEMEVEFEDNIASEELKLENDDINQLTGKLNYYYEYWVLLLEPNNNCVYYACKEKESVDFRDVLETIATTTIADCVIKYSKGISENEYYNKFCCD